MAQRGQFVASARNAWTSSAGRSIVTVFVTDRAGGGACTFPTVGPSRATVAPATTDGQGECPCQRRQWVPPAAAELHIDHVVREHEPAQGLRGRPLRVQAGEWPLKAGCRLPALRAAARCPPRYAPTPETAAPARASLAPVPWRPRRRATQDAA